MSRKLFFESGYFVTSSPLSYIYEKSVYLPNINYSSIKNFWRNVSKKEYNVGNVEPRKLITEISKLLPEKELLKEEEIKKMKKDWERIKNRFEKYYKFMFPEVARTIRKIVIMPTRYGSIGSYSYQKIKKEHYIPLYIRFDCPVDVIVQLIILATVHYVHFSRDFNERKMIKNGKWFKKQEISNFLIKNTSLKELTKNYPKDIQASDKISKESKKYLESLGFFQKHKFVAKNGNITDSYNNLEIKNLTKSEAKILKFLIRNKGRTASFDKIAEKLWGKKVEKKYSLYAITRLITDIRQKIRDNGIHSELIHTQRGKGYMLYD